MVALYLDTGDLTQMEKWAQEVEGFTTNPSLMKAAGVKHYLDFAKKALEIAEDKPISFEVFPSSAHADTLTMQAEELQALGKNVFVKVPHISADGFDRMFLIEELWRKRIQVNITAILSHEQIDSLRGHLPGKTPMIVSIFAGRIADTGQDPSIWINRASMICRTPNIKILWASAREVYNIKHAADCKADIITLSPALLAKHLEMHGKDLNEIALKTVQQFDADSKGIAF